MSSKVYQSVPSSASKDGFSVQVVRPELAARADHLATTWDDDGSGSGSATPKTLEASADVPLIDEVGVKDRPQIFSSDVSPVQVVHVVFELIAYGRFRNRRTVKSS